MFGQANVAPGALGKGGLYLYLNSGGPRVREID